MPEWWGLYVEGQLVRVVRWCEPSRPTLADFGVAARDGVEYDVSPVHVPAVHWTPEVA